MGWQQQAALRVVPAQQSLGAANLSGSQIKLRLIVQLELCLRDCTAKLAFERHARVRF
jgi:hypothetical protein